MIPIALIDTTFSGKDLTTAGGISVYEYTAVAAVTMRIQLRLTGVAGGGDYTAHIKFNDGDAQTDDAVAPKTTYTAGVGETSFWFATLGKIDLLAGDVINIFVLGLTGDNSESGSIRIFTDAEIASIFSGITSLANWLRGLARKDAMNSTAKTELNTGGGTYNEATDSQEGARDTLPAAIEDAVLDAAMADHEDPDSIGEAISNAGNLADPLENEVPGEYESGTAGHALGRIGSGQIVTVSPVAQNGDVETIQGDDYLASEGRSLDWTNTDGDWPDLIAISQGGSIAIRVIIGGVVELAGSVVTATGENKKVRCEPASTETAAIRTVQHLLQVIAEWADDEDVIEKTITLMEGKWTSKARLIAPS